MISILSAINISILTLLGFLHIYWAFGGSWAAEKALPESPEGKPLFAPGIFACIVVAAGLLIFASVFIFHSFISITILPEWFMANSLWFIGTIFILRAIGDFRYVGFMKKIRHSTFASLDTKYYSPLCLYLGISSFIINLGI
ncbi:DUF3995 domain-containing protein [Fulvivirga ulvae]|uniref:DUF3995 domain-containing protein n=1 Tax=Fulvivirga ulvae TaxID=2904245 RepID=UPI001F33017A|nr:DUF3995 domain-containing protein [Fulvivirga ulvae]UII32378.1 DUF3995 domain-containing protein [Fulvivirga ulvae]